MFKENWQFCTLKSCFNSQASVYNFVNYFWGVNFSVKFAWKLHMFLRRRRVQNLCEMMQYFVEWRECDWLMAWRFHVKRIRNVFQILSVTRRNIKLSSCVQYSKRTCVLAQICKGRGGPYPFCDGALFTFTHTCIIFFPFTNLLSRILDEIVQ